MKVVFVSAIKLRLFSVILREVFYKFHWVFVTKFQNYNGKVSVTKFGSFSRF